MYKLRNGQILRRYRGSSGLQLHCMRIFHLLHRGLQRLLGLLSQGLLRQRGCRLVRLVRSREVYFVHGSHGVQQLWDEYV